MQLTALIQVLNRGNHAGRLPVLWLQVGLDEFLDVCFDESRVDDKRRNHSIRPLRRYLSTSESSGLLLLKNHSDA